jgi:hypothetical protein
MMKVIIEKKKKRKREIHRFSEDFALLERTREVLNGNVSRKGK